VYPHPPFKRGSEGLDPFAQKLADVFTSAANLAGVPAMSFPASLENGLPIGMQLLARSHGEELLFRACADVERVFPAPRPPRFAADGSR
jgi:aspartyl-tRNA(Asn)/glutamyl-tRNA(Gln) amidotransferase subunit A